ncbi:ComEA family DNA-binding protein [Paenibacillus sp. GCM10023252]|uniref:ComEA family DNA-binding protein n=1 Tax=Paenibacillus sp. GCM10023252 TaxID=3252649 RepID=UPI00360AC98A
MGKYTNKPSSSRLLLIAVLAVTAGCLFIAALQEPKEEKTTDWIRLDRQVADVLGDGEAEHQVSGTQKEGGNEVEMVGPNEREKEGGHEPNEGLNEEGVHGQRKGQMGEGNSAQGAAAAGAGKLNINQATAEELDELKGIGPSKAQAIVDDRELHGFYTRIEEITRVKGIGEKLFEGIKDSIVAVP